MIKKIGTTSLTKITTQSEMDEFVAGLGIKSDKVIIKPNWVEARMGAHTDAKVLDMFLTALKKPAIIVESYTFWRTDKYLVCGGDYYSSGEATLETGKKHWNHFKKQDAWFLSATGIDEILKKHNAEYLNITNEVWEKRTVDSQVIQKIVEDKYEPVLFKELYSYVPQRLFDLKGADFISFAKAKKEVEYSFTLSTKNLFGLIPDPTRYPKYHGDSDKQLSVNICDINKIYRSLFDCTFLVDGVFTASSARSMQEIFTVKDWGIILAGKNSIEVDMIGAKLLGAKPPTTGMDLLKESKSVFGESDQNLLSEIPSEWTANFDLG